MKVPMARIEEKVTIVELYVQAETEEGKWWWEVRQGENGESRYQTQHIFILSLRG